MKHRIIQPFLFALGFALVSLLPISFAQTACQNLATLALTAEKSYYLVNEAIVGEVLFTSFAAAPASVDVTTGVTKDGQSILSKSYTLTVQPGQNRWTIKDAFGSDTLSLPGTYVLSVTFSHSSTGCSWTKSLTLTAVAAPKPQIGSLNPDAGPPGIQVTISGSGFTPTGNTVQSNGAVVADNLGSADGKTLAFTVPAASPGEYPLSVSNSNGISNEMTFAVVAAQALCSTEKAAPYAAAAKAKAQELGVQLSGSNFLGCDQRNMNNSQAQDTLPADLTGYDGVIFYNINGVTSGNGVNLPKTPLNFMVGILQVDGGSNIDLNFKGTSNLGLYIAITGGGSNVSVTGAPAGTSYEYVLSGGGSNVAINGLTIQQGKGKIPGGSPPSAACKPTTGIPESGIFGIGPGEFYPWSASPRDLDALKELGVKWTRVDFRWDQIEKQKGQFDWSFYDNVATQFKENNIRILAILSGTPGWANGGKDVFYPPTDPNDYANFAKEIAKRYQPRGISYWEIWNEPNLDMFWKPSSDVKSYTQLLALSNKAIREVDSNAIILNGGLSNFGNPSEFFKGIYESGGKNCFDVLAHHPYGVDPRDPQGFSGVVDAIKKILADNGDVNKPIWFNEYGFTTGIHPGGITEAQQAEALRLTFAQKDVVPAFFWFSLRDFDSPVETYGLLRHDFSKKPAFDVLKNLLNPSPNILSSLAINPKEYFLGQTVTGSVTLLVPQPVKANFRAELFKDSTLVWSRNVNDVQITAGTQTFSLDDVFGFKPAIPNDPFYAGNWKLKVSKVDTTGKELEFVSGTFVIKVPELKLTLTIDPKEYQLGETLKGGGTITNPGSSPVTASFKAELLQGRTSRWSRELNSITIPSGASQFTLQDIFGGEPKIPNDSQYIGNWKLVIAQIGTSATVEDGFEIKSGDVSPSAGISVNVDAAITGRDISKLKRGFNDLTWNKAPSSAYKRYGDEIGYDKSLVNIYFWGGLSTRDPAPLEATLKQLQEAGNADIMLTFMGIPQEFSSAPNDTQLLNNACLRRWAGVPVAPGKFSQWKEYMKEWIALAKKYNVKYYQILVEPDLGQELIDGKYVGCYWSGSADDLLIAYQQFAEAIKDGYDGQVPADIKIGGPGLFYYGSSIRGSEPIGKMLPRFARENSLPLDFFSWHQYQANPTEPKTSAALIRSELDKNGFTNAELIVSEHDQFWDWQNPTGPSVKWKTHQRAALLGANLANMANQGIARQMVWVFSSASLFGDAENQYSGLFGIETGVTKPEFNLYKAISKMGDMMIGVDSQPSAASDYVWATKSSDKVSVMMVNFNNAAVSGLKLNIKNVPSSFTSYTKYIIDATHSNAYQVEAKIKARMDQAREDALPVAEKTFKDYLLAKGYPASAVETALEMLRKYLANSNDATLIGWLNSLTPQQKQDVTDAFAQAQTAYQNIINLVADEINAWPEVKLYSETKTVTIPATGIYQETITLEPYAVQVIVLSQKPISTKNSPSAYLGNLLQAFTNLFNFNRDGF